MNNNQSGHRGVILMNLGSVESTDVQAVKKYLDEFLMDAKVIDYPYLFRLLLVKGIITPKRSPRTAEAYKKIWWQEGSPLTVITRRLQKLLQDRLEEPVEIMMRYGDPHPATAFRSLMERDPLLREVIVVPLYPHYAMSSYETAVEYARHSYEKGKYPFKLSVIKPFYQEPDYIHALAENIRPSLKQDFDYVLFSYHGVPERHIHKSDITHHHCLRSENCCFTESPAHSFCYRHQVITTMNLTAKELGLTEGKYGISFQSRLGRAEWIRPYTVDVLRELPGKGIKKLVVVSPAFVADCLETLEEIGMEGKEIFMNAGGESFQMVPALNTNSGWVDVLTKWVKEYASGEKEMADSV
jgi:ferrochelatase